jgi:hypothetical protein
MNKNLNNIFDAGITPEEMKKVFGEVATKEEYLRKVKDESWRLYNISELLYSRGEDELARFYLAESHVEINDYCF